MSGDFAHLHVHTEYSLLDGQSRIQKLVERAAEMGHPALGITDHGVMYGVMDFFRAAKQAGIKPIIGMEAYLAPRSRFDRDPAQDKRPYHMLLLAKDMKGYQNLLELASLSQLEGYYYRPRIDRELMAKHSAGLIATSGCLAAEIPRLVEEGREQEARDQIGWYHEVFGPERFYLELQGHDIPQLHALNQWLFAYRQSGHSPVQFLATNDVHYVNEDDTDPHDTLLCIQTSALKSEDKRMRLDPWGSYYLKSSDEMLRDFDGAPVDMIDEAFANSLKIADMSEVELEHEGYHLPVFPVPRGFDEQSYLRHLVEMGLSWRFPGNEHDHILRERIERELDIIHTMGFDTYFLIVWDLCEFARAADIWWNVRGSGAGSLVAYCLGITNIDPIQNSLLFERFLNPGRVSMPDIDLDYPDDRRKEMIAYTVRKYGEERVAAIITFGTMGAKAAVRDVARAMDVDLGRVNQAVALIPQEARQKTIMEYVEANPELKTVYENDRELKVVIDTAAKLQGMTRHASTHAAGVIVSDAPLVQYLPLHRITGTDPSGGWLKAVTQFPMETAESIGLLKVDFLGLATLTILRKACDLINEHQGLRYTMDDIPYRHDDARLTERDREMLDKTFEMMGRGETVGVFQVESPGMQQMLRGMKPKTFENVIAGISLYRPGPMDFIPQYNDRLHGIEEPQYLHPKLESILGETYGIIVYQEQIMQIAGELFGYELGEADLMRRAVSKKKEKALLEHAEIFKERGPKNGIPEDVAEKIFEEIKFFANYGFNKSHASDYAVITVQTAFLKAHYPEEYMTALLCVHADDATKIATFLAEARRLGIPIWGPNINCSQLDFAIEHDDQTGKRGIRFGLAGIKNASETALQHLIDERNANGPFATLEDLCYRVDLRQVGKRTLESLIRVGALPNFGDRQTLIENLDRIVQFSTRHHQDQAVGQMTLFGDDAGDANKLTLLAPDQPKIERDYLRWEKELLGVYVTGRPVDKLQKDLEQLELSVIADILGGGERVHISRRFNDYTKKYDAIVRVAGEVVSVRKLVTQKQNLMVIIQLEDWHETAATIEVVIFPATWEDVQQAFAERGNEFKEGEVILVKGKLEKRGGQEDGNWQIAAELVTQDFGQLQIANDEDMPQALDEPQEATPHPDDYGEYGDYKPSLAEMQEAARLLPSATAQKQDDRTSYRPSGTSANHVNGHHANGHHNGHNSHNGHHSPNGNEPSEPALSLTLNPETPCRHIHIALPRSDSPQADRRLLRLVGQTVMESPGQDRFSLSIRYYGQERCLHFPHTHVCLTEQVLEQLYEYGVTDEHIHIHEKPPAEMLRS